MTKGTYLNGSGCDLTLVGSVTSPWVRLRGDVGPQTPVRTEKGGLSHSEDSGSVEVRRVTWFMFYRKFLLNPNLFAEIHIPKETT